MIQTCVDAGYVIRDMRFLIPDAGYVIYMRYISSHGTLIQYGLFIIYRYSVPDGTGKVKIIVFAATAIVYSMFGGMWSVAYVLYILVIRKINLINI